MSESLRDQLMQAGFSAPQEPDRTKKNRTGKPSKAAGKTRSRAARSEAGQQDAPNRPPARQAAANRHTRSSTGPEIDAQAARRKAVKAEIKTLIEAAAIRDFAGESVYRFILNKRIRELHVTGAIRQQLVAGTLVITRLNGTTWLVPAETSMAIRALNPEWAVVTPAADEPEDNNGYEDFPVPDDLQW